MSLAFLTPDATPARELRARSPMERLAVQAGARLARVEGWNVPNAYDEPPVERARLTASVGFVDRSSLAKLELHAPAATLARVLAGLGGQPAPALGTAVRFALDPSASASASASTSTSASSSADGAARAWWCPVTPQRALVLCEPRDAPALRAALAGAPGEDAADEVGVVDVTCGLAALSLVGPQARELLARFCAIDVRPAVSPPASFRPGSVARTPGYVLVEDDERLLVLVGWALGAYLWQVVADAAAHVDGGPVGAEALAQHLQTAAARERTAGAAGA